MFGSLKKRLKETINKVSKAIKEEKPVEEPVEEPMPEPVAELEQIKEEIVQPSETKEEKPVEEPKEAPEEAKQEPLPEEPIPEPDIPEEPEEIKEPIKEEPLPEEKLETKPEIPEEVVKEEPKPLVMPEPTHLPKEPVTKVKVEEPEEKKEAEPAVVRVKEPEIKVKEISEAKPPAVKLPKEEPKEKKDFLGRIFGRAKEKTLSESDIEKILKALQMALLENDTALETAEKICADVKASLLNKTVKRGEIDKVIKESLRYAILDVMSQEKIDLDKLIMEKDGPLVIVFFGFNGTGKCVSGNTLIQLSDGEIIPIEELYEYNKQISSETKINDGYIIEPTKNTDILTTNLKSLKIESAPIERLWKLKKDKLLKVTLSNGQQIEVTPEHPFFVLKSRKIATVKAANLKYDDFVMIPKRIVVAQNEISAYGILKKIQHDKLFIHSRMFVKKLYTNLLRDYKTYKKAWKALKPGVAESTFVSIWRKENKMASDFAIRMCGMYPELKSLIENCIIKYKNSSNKMILNTLSKDFYKFMGLFYSEGYMYKNYIEFTNTDRELINEFIRSIKSSFDIEKFVIKEDKRNTRIKKVQICNATLSYFVRKFMDIPTSNKSKEMYIPQYLLSVSNEKIVEFIKWYWEGDGSIDKNLRVLEATTKSQRFSQQLSMLLLRFGIIASIGKREINGETFYRISINGKNKILAFDQKIGTVTQKRQQKIKHLIEIPSQFEISELVPNQGLLFKSIREENCLNQVQLSDILKVQNSLISQYESPKYQVSIPIERIGRFLEITDTKNKFPEKLVNGDVSWIKVEKIEISDNPDEYVYDLTVPKTHNFIAGNFIVHNTTTIAKFAHKYKKYKPILAAGDTFRAASIEQIEEHARRLGVSMIKHMYGSDSAAVIFDAVKHAKATGSKVVLADTAGRSHSNVNLMDELKKVVRVNNPDLKVLVLDSITGNDIYEQSKLFNDAVGVDAMILTKADVYEKGGAALAASHTIEKPILFLGIGQDYSDLKEFNPEEIVNNLLE